MAVLQLRIGHIAGSFNFTKQAENANAENLLVIRDTTPAEKYVVNWKAHGEHSEAYEGRASDAPATTKSRNGLRRAPKKPG
jgi:phosphatidylserine/phosphatidylglycerophosphate/cardiolipin synthase-like enzyme